MFCTKNFKYFFAQKELNKASKPSFHHENYLFSIEAIDFLSSNLERYLTSNDVL